MYCRQCMHVTPAADSYTRAQYNTFSFPPATRDASGPCHALQEIHQLRAAELHEAVSQGVMLLTLELPVFPHAVLYQQSLSAAAVVAQAAGAPGAGAAAAGGGGGPAAGVADIIRFQDPEVRLLLGAHVRIVYQRVWFGASSAGNRGWCVWGFGC